jgi:hypothetical protein
MKHPSPSLFQARLYDLIDLGAGDVAHALQQANDRDTLIEELNYQLRQDGVEKRSWNVVLTDLLDDLDAPTTVVVPANDENSKARIAKLRADWAEAWGVGTPTAKRACPEWASNMKESHETDK